MKIKQIATQCRRDFRADLECETCGFIVYNISGYDDAFFHQSVIPDMKCSECGAKSPANYRPLQTKYPDGFQV